MSVIAAQLIAEVKASGVEETSRQLGEVGKRANETKGHFEGLKNALSTAGGFAIFAGVGAGIGFLKDQIGDVIKLSAQHGIVEAQTAQALKSTKDASGETAGALAKLAEQFGKTTMYSADTVQQGENMLLTFTNIGKKGGVFDAATQATLDMSQALGQDTTSSAMQLGKALDDPIRGVTALQRVGVTFTQQQKDSIKTFMKHNDVMDAQKVILDELSKEFGGSATAAGKTFSGQMAILGNQFDDIKIKIGGALLPVLSDLMNKYVVPLAGRFADWMTKGGGLNDFKGWIQTASNFLQGQLIPALGQMLNQEIIPLAGWMYTTFVKSGLLKDVWDGTNNVLSKLIPQLGSMASNVGHFVDFLTKANPQAAIMRDVLGGIAAVVATQKISSMVTDVAHLASSMSGFVENAGKNMLAFLTGNGGLEGSMQGVGDASQIAGGEIATAGHEAAVAGGEFSTMGGDAAVATPEVAGLGNAAMGAFGWASKLAGISLLGVTLGGSNGAQSVQSALDKSAGLGTNKAWLQYEWEKVHGFNNFGVMPNFNNMNSSQQSQIMSDWYSKNSGAFPWSQATAHASGILNSPTSHWAMVGEQGPELAFVPKGTSIFPHGTVPSGLGNSGPINVHLTLQTNGQTYARAILPDIVDLIRNTTGVRF